MTTECALIAAVPDVLVLWLPYLGVTPDEFFMTRLGKTDVWCKTIQVNRKMRLAYTLAPNVGRVRPLSLGFAQRQRPCQIPLSQALPHRP